MLDKSFSFFFNDKIEFKIFHFFYTFLYFIKGRFGRVIIIPKDGKNTLLRKEVFTELRQLDDIIQNATVHYDGDTFTYRDACARWENECFTNDILNLDYIIDDVSIRFGLNQFPLLYILFTRFDDDLPFFTFYLSISQK